MPPGGEYAFRVAVPSGAQIEVPLPEGTMVGDAVDELTSLQLSELPARHRRDARRRYHHRARDGRAVSESRPPPQASARAQEPALSEHKAADVHVRNRQCSGD